MLGDTSETNSSESFHEHRREAVRNEESFCYKSHIFSSFLLSPPPKCDNFHAPKCNGKDLFLHLAKLRCNLKVYEAKRISEENIANFLQLSELIYGFRGEGRKRSDKLFAWNILERRDREMRRPGRELIPTEKLTCAFLMPTANEQNYYEESFTYFLVS